MSKHYEKVLRHYSMGVWPKSRVRAAVEKGWITAAEYKNITGEVYVVGR